MSIEPSSEPLPEPEPGLSPWINEEPKNSTKKLNDLVLPPILRPEDN